jgi:CHAT domain
LDSLRGFLRRPALIDLQTAGQPSVLNNALALSSSERDDAGIRAINIAIDNARTERGKTRAEIARRFPSYADLIDPKSPTVEEMRQALRPGEALVSFYFGRERSFVWAVPKEGAVAFASISATAAELESNVHMLRQSLEPQAVRTLYDIPPFDLGLAYHLYHVLLEPVEAGWKQANSLIVVTNGALALLPLSLLPTAPIAVTEPKDPSFAQYRTVPWLARSHAVSMVPSAAALQTLRQLPPGSVKREPLIGFGDPLFSPEQVAEAEGPQSREPLLEVASQPDRDLPLRSSRCR